MTDQPPEHTAQLRLAEERISFLLKERQRIAKIINPDAIEVPHDGDLEIWARRCEDERKAYFGNLQAAIELMKRFIAADDAAAYALGVGTSDFTEEMREFVKTHDINAMLKEPK